MNIQKIIGKISKVRIVAVIKPPIITIAKGFCDSEPIPVDIAAGNKPIAAIDAVITTGRMRVSTPTEILLLSGMRSLRFCRKTETRITPFWKHKFQTKQ